MFRLAVLNSHPIQYFVPFYRRLSLEPDIDLTVFFCSRMGLEAYFDTHFGESVQWDIPLLEGYQYEFLPNQSPTPDSGRFWSNVNPAIVSRLRDGRFDAIWIHSHQYVTMPLAVLAAKLSRTAAFMRCETHLLLKRSAVKQMLRKPIMTGFYSLFDGCLPIGSRNEAFYRAHGVPEERLFLVPYSVDNVFFSQYAEISQDVKNELRRERNLPVSKPLILFASNFLARKHPLDLLMAFARLRDSKQDASLMYVGSGELEADLLRYIEQNDVPDVYFLGFQHQMDLPSIYAAADIFVLPSENEPWGLVINEAMAAGLPVIASEEIGATADLVQDGINGFTFPAGDVDVLTERLELLVADSHLRKEMGSRSREIIANWDIERGVEGIRAAMAFVKRSEGQEEASGRA